jgi:hypothetical protein
MRKENIAFYHHTGDAIETLKYYSFDYVHHAIFNKIVNSLDCCLRLNEAANSSKLNGSWKVCIGKETSEDGRDVWETFKLDDVGNALTLSRIVDEKVSNELFRGKLLEFFNSFDPYDNYCQGEDFIHECDVSEMVDGLFCEIEKFENEEYHIIPVIDAKPNGRYRKENVST